MDWRALVESLPSRLQIHGLREHLFVFIETEEPTGEHLSGVQQEVLPQIHDILLQIEEALCAWEAAQKVGNQQ